MTDEHSPKRRRWPWYLGGGAAAVAIALVVALGTGVFTPDEPEAAPEPSQQPGFSQTPQPSPSTSDDPADDSAPAPEPSISIDAVSTMPYTPVWDPQDNGEGWWQIVDPEHGYPENGGTDYLLAHACYDAVCAGDRMRELDPGDTFSYLGELYVVDEKFEIAKNEIAQQDIWEHHADRVVIITCIIDPATRTSTENDIFVATRVG